MLKAVVLLAALVGTFQGCHADSVTYGDLGTFEYGAGTSICHHQMPEDPAVIGTRFFLYTPTNKFASQELFRDSVNSVWNSDFSASKHTKFIIHGWTDVYTSDWAQDMKNAIVDQDKNVIMVDWQNGAGNPNYAISRADTRVVGREVGSMILTLQAARGATLNSMHVIGHSLGGHTAGYAGEYLPGIGRLTGLDPAGPEFVGCPYYCKLDPTDSGYVDVIHSDGTSLGLMEEIGDQDFYPNGGEMQPGCEGTGVIEACNHMRAVHLFTDSIANPCNPYKKCNVYTDYPNCNNCGTTCPDMGYHALEAKGTDSYFVTTASTAPFC